MQTLTATLLIAALAPGVTVLCLSSTGHAAFENQLCACCAAIPTPCDKDHSGVWCEADCLNCTDIPVLGIQQAERRLLLQGYDQALMATPDPEAPQGTGVLLAARTWSDVLCPVSLSSNPLRC